MFIVHRVVNGHPQYHSPDSGRGFGRGRTCPSVYRLTVVLYSLWTMWCSLWSFWMVIFVAFYLIRLRFFWHLNEWVTLCPPPWLSSVVPVRFFAGRDNFFLAWSWYLCAFRNLCWLWQFLGHCVCRHCPCIPVTMSVRDFSFFLVLILLLLVFEVIFQARKSRDFLVPARLTRGRSTGSPFIRCCWTLIEFWLLSVRTVLTWGVITLDCSTMV